jgi:hypothetical protein
MRGKALPGCAISRAKQIQMRPSAPDAEPEMTATPGSGAMTGPGQGGIGVVSCRVTLDVPRRGGMADL